MNRRLYWLGVVLALSGVVAAACSSGSGRPDAAICDLPTQTGCPGATSRCTLRCGPGLEITCVADGTLPIGAPCPDGDSCAAGGFCASTAEDPTPSCRKFCATDAECVAGYTCMQRPIGLCGQQLVAGLCLITSAP